MNAPRTTAVALDLPFAVYDAFTSVPYSGSQGASVLDAAAIDAKLRARIAVEIGAPATAFVDTWADNRIKLQFFSTIAEQPMCGHGTVCLITRMVDAGLISCPPEGTGTAILELPNGNAQVEFHRNEAGRLVVMLDVAIAAIEPAMLDFDRLGDLLSVTRADFAYDLPIQVARADFIHLCLPMRNLAAMARLRPNFDALAQFCRANKIETVAAFSMEVEQPGMTLHIRDFCPAVGVAESAGAGTTNAAVAAYLLHNGRVTPDATGQAVVWAEQGIELSRPSNVITRATVEDGSIKRLQVGGIATKVIEGHLNVVLGQ